MTVRRALVTEVCQKVNRFIGMLKTDPLMTQPARLTKRMSFSESGPTGRITLDRPSARPIKGTFRGTPKSIVFLTNSQSLTTPCRQHRMP